MFKSSKPLFMDDIFDEIESQIDVLERKKNDLLKLHPELLLRTKACKTFLKYIELISRLDSPNKDKKILLNCIKLINVPEVIKIDKNVFTSNSKIIYPSEDVIYAMSILKIKFEFTQK